MGWREKGKEHPSADWPVSLKPDFVSGPWEHDKSLNEELAASLPEPPRRPELTFV